MVCSIKKTRQKFSRPVRINLKMSRRLRLTALCFCLALNFAFTVQAQSGRSVIVITAEGPVTPVMISHVQRAIAAAQERDAEAVIIRLNTPGGQIDLMNRIVTAILESRKPVIVYVSPRGGMAASAGTVITLAAHANAMAPNTTIGAASPVGGQGEDIGETLEAKVKNELKAQVRALASERSPEAIRLAEATIEEAKAVTATEAKEIGLTDFIAADLPDLLRQLDGFTVNINDAEVTLQTANAAVVELEVNFLEQLLAILTNPNVIAILLFVGVQAILIEISTPGGWVAGFLGAVCLALAFYGMGVLPVNWFGIVFIVLAFVLFIMDFNAPTHGALTAAATGSLIAGVLILFNSPGSLPYLRVSVPLVIGASLALGSIFFVVMLLALRTRRLPPQMGVETLGGKVGQVTQTLRPRGIVQLDGEEWTAETDGETIESGEKVEVVEVKGLKLRVKKK